MHTPNICEAHGCAEEIDEVNVESWEVSGKFLCADCAQEDFDRRADDDERPSHDQGGDGTKPHHGRITDWWLHYPLSDFEPPAGAPGYIVRGDLIDHPMWDARDPWMKGSGYTSWVLVHDEATGEVETQNSRYRLVGKPKHQPTDARSHEHGTKQEGAK